MNHTHTEREREREREMDLCSPKVLHKFMKYGTAYFGYLLLDITGNIFLEILLLL